MKKPLLPILTTLLISTILRFYNLGSVPAGLSLTEVQFGLWLSRFGTLFLNPIIVRLPFAILGVFSIYLSYILINKLFEDKKNAIVSSFLLAIIPWHVQESRIFSWGMILFFSGEVLFLLTVKYIRKLYLKIPKFNYYLGSILLLALILIPIPGLSIKVDDARLAVSKNSSDIISKVFINKLTENYREREQMLFTNLDFGNYFFAGHPRERGGIEETQKLLLFLLPFILFGLFKIKKEQGNLFLSWTIISLFILTLLNLQESQSLLLIFPLIVLGSVGIVDVVSSKNRIIKTSIVLIFIFGLFETVSFYNLYFLSHTENQFSPRRPIYIQLSEKLMELKKPGETILVNDRIGNPKEFLSFYLKKNIEGFDFRSFSYSNENGQNRLFVDVLPDDPGSGEPLYTKDGSWPGRLNVLAQFYDSGKREKVVVYRIK